jgi:hypothetical protein
MTDWTVTAMTFPIYDPELDASVLASEGGIATIPPGGKNAAYSRCTIPYVMGMSSNDELYLEMQNAAGNTVTMTDKSDLTMADNCGDWIWFDHVGVYSWTKLTAVEYKDDGTSKTVIYYPNGTITDNTGNVIASHSLSISDITVIAE